MIVLVTGVFDLLHAQHLAFLTKARQFTDQFSDAQLVVGIETDARVKQLKGPTRPINSEQTRKKNLSLLTWQDRPLLDQVLILPEQFATASQHEAFIAKLAPKYLLVSSHTPNLAAKKAILQKYGAEVIVIHKFNPAISTTALLKQSANS